MKLDGSEHRYSLVSTISFTPPGRRISCNSPSYRFLIWRRARAAAAHIGIGPHEAGAMAFTRMPSMGQVYRGAPTPYALLDVNAALEAMLTITPPARSAMRGRPMGSPDPNHLQKMVRHPVKRVPVSPVNTGKTGLFREKTGGSGIWRALRVSIPAAGRRNRVES